MLEEVDDLPSDQMAGRLSLRYGSSLDDLRKEMGGSQSDAIAHVSVVIGLTKSGQELTQEHPEVRVDVLERLPAPYGLVRYGVAPDHPRIKEIVKALRRVLGRDRIRFLGNVEYGTDLKLGDLQQHYDAVVFSTGAGA